MGEFVLLHWRRLLSLLDGCWIYSTQPKVLQEIQKKTKMFNNTFLFVEISLNQEQWPQVFCKEISEKKNQGKFCTTHFLFPPDHSSSPKALRVRRKPQRRRPRRPPRPWRPWEHRRRGPRRWCEMWWAPARRCGLPNLGMMWKVGDGCMDGELRRWEN